MTKELNNQNFPRNGRIVTPAKRCPTDDLPSSPVVSGLSIIGKAQLLRRGKNGS